MLWNHFWRSSLKSGLRSWRLSLNSKIGFWVVWDLESTKIAITLLQVNEIEIWKMCSLELFLQEWPYIHDHIPKKTILEYTKTSIVVYMSMPYNVTEYKVILVAKVLKNTFFRFRFHWLGAKLSWFSYFQGLTLAIPDVWANLLFKIAMCIIWFHFMQKFILNRF